MLQQYCSMPVFYIAAHISQYKYIHMSGSDKEPYAYMYVLIL